MTSVPVPGCPTWQPCSVDGIELPPILLMTLISLEVFSFATTWPLNVNEPMEDPLAPPVKPFRRAHERSYYGNTRQIRQSCPDLVAPTCPIGF